MYTSLSSRGRNIKMKHRAKKLALALTIISAVNVGGYVSARVLDAAPSAAQQEKQKAFEEYLAQKEAEFEQEFNEVKQRNDELRREFDSLPKSSEAEVRSAVAQSLNKSARK